MQKAGRTRKGKGHFTVVSDDGKVLAQGYLRAHAGGPAACCIPLHKPGGTLPCGHGAGNWGRHPHQGLKPPP